MDSHVYMVILSSRIHSDHADTIDFRRIMNVKQLHDMKVTVSPHRSLNSCTGVITSKELSKLKEEEIQAELEEVGVSKVKIITRQGDDRINTSRMILTFKGTNPATFMRDT